MQWSQMDEKGYESSPYLTACRPLSLSNILFHSPSISQSKNAWFWRKIKKFLLCLIWGLMTAGRKVLAEGSCFGGYILRFESACSSQFNMASNKHDSQIKGRAECTEVQLQQNPETPKYQVIKGRKPGWVLAADVHKPFHCCTRGHTNHAATKFVPITEALLKTIVLDL